MTTVQDVIDRLSNQPSHKTICVVIWQPVDVHDRIADMEWEAVTNAEAEEIIAAVEHQHDSNYGITWDHLDNAIFEAHSNRKEITFECVAIGQTFITDPLGGHSGIWVKTEPVLGGLICSHCGENGMNAETENGDPLTHLCKNTLVRVPLMDSHEDEANE